jgi:hypothetical protein
MKMNSRTLDDAAGSSTSSTSNGENTDGASSELTVADICADQYDWSQVGQSAPTDRIGHR